MMTYLTECQFTLRSTYKQHTSKQTNTNSNYNLDIVIIKVYNWQIVSSQQKVSTKILLFRLTNSGVKSL